MGKGASEYGIRTHTSFTSLRAGPEMPIVMGNRAACNKPADRSPAIGCKFAKSRELLNSWRKPKRRT